MLAALALPGTAAASSVSVVQADSCAGDIACEKYGAGTPVPVTTVAGAAGEANRVSVTQQGSDFVIQDRGAPLTAAAPCQALDANTARCPVTTGEPAIRGLSIALGDGDDNATVAGTKVEATFDGGPGADVVTGGGENDQMDGGPGDDRLAGGGGFDELVYSQRTRPVVVDLAAGTGGEDGEADTLSSFETLLGGRAADVLRGSARGEVIDGLGGADAISGRGGKDDLFGGVGADRLNGGSGNDRLFGDPAQGDGEYEPIIKLQADRLSGGPGDDSLFDTGGRNVYLGGPGNDSLEGGAGPDRMLGGPGKDDVVATGGGRDRVNCGSGRDRAATDRRDRRRSCEGELRIGATL